METFLEKAKNVLITVAPTIASAIGTPMAGIAWARAHAGPQHPPAG